MEKYADKTLGIGEISFDGFDRDETERLSLVFFRTVFLR